ncbi:hypothetical protein FOL47_009284, partial [Perkinsus chesapeaki]
APSCSSQPIECHSDAPPTKNANSEPADYLDEVWSETDIASHDGSDDSVSLSSGDESDAESVTSHSSEGSERDVPCSEHPSAPSSEHDDCYNNINLTDNDERRDSSDEWDDDSSATSAHRTDSSSDVDSGNWDNDSAVESDHIDNGGGSVKFTP